MTEPAQAFADRLSQLEEGRDLAAFVEAAFTDDVELERPELDRAVTGRDGATTFWQQYLDQFETVRSEFSRVSDGSPAVLEWRSQGRLANGDPVDYRGVSLLDVDGSGLVSRFVTYYDTQAFGSAARAV